MLDDYNNNLLSDNGHDHPQWSDDDCYRMNMWDRVWLGIALLVATVLVAVAAAW